MASKKPDKAAKKPAAGQTKVKKAPAKPADKAPGKGKPGRKADPHKRPLTSIRIPKEQHAKLAQLAKKVGMTVQRTAEQALWDGMNRFGQPVL